MNYLNYLLSERILWMLKRNIETFLLSAQKYVWIRNIENNQYMLYFWLLLCAPTNGEEGILFWCRSHWNQHQDRPRYDQGLHRLEKYLNLEGFLEKSLKMKSALKSTGKSRKSLEKSLNLIIFCRT